MKYLLLLFVFSSCSFSEHRCPPHRAMSMHACRGSAYTGSFQASMMSPQIACCWPDENPDTEPGYGYKESQAAAEDADCVGDEDY